MAILTGSVLLPVEVLGGVQITGTGELSASAALPGASLAGGDADVVAGKKINTDASAFGPEASRVSVISALNSLGSMVDLKIDLASLSGGEMIDHNGSGEFSINAAEFSASFGLALGASDTDDVSEGSSNLYFTEARGRAAISVTDAGGDGSLAYDNSTGVITYTGPSASEVRAHVSAGEMLNVADGAFSIDAAQFSASFGLALAASDTDDVSEGTSNLYFTDARARAAISVTDNGGDGSLAYDSGTGVISYTGPSAAEVQAHLSAGAALDYAGGEFSLKVDDSSVEVNGSDKLQVKAGGITNAMLNGSIENEKLSNSTISGISLGSNLASLSAGTGITMTSYNGSAAVNDLVVDQSFAPTWTGIHKFDEPLQLKDQADGSYFKLSVADGFLKVVEVS